MSERRNDPRPGHNRERRSFPRPPLWLNLLLLIIAAGTFVYAKHRRDTLGAKTALLFRKSDSPADLNRMRDDLAQMDLTKQQLAKELDGRMQYLQTLQSEQFYISIDSTKKKFQFRLGKEVLRDADVETGQAKTLTSKEGKTWTFYPLKGGFGVTGKQSDYEMPIAEWVYALHGEAIPQQRPAVKNWLGRYVIYLPDGYVIHSPPPKDSLVQGPKPGSFMVPEDDLAAIWPRVTTQTRVYIF